MQQRYFLVQPDNNDYKLRELTPEIAESINKFGSSSAHYYTIDKHNSTFYFMNCSISKARAEELSDILVQNISNDTHQS